MITDLHIIKGLHNVIKKYFPDIPIIDKDIKDVVRPAFYITDISRKDTNISSQFFESTKSFNITFFGSDQNTGNLELVKIKEYLSNIFLKPIKINIKTDKEVKKLFYVEIDDIDVRVNRTDNFVSCDLLIVVQQQKINVTTNTSAQSAQDTQDTENVYVDYENNLDVDYINKELMGEIYTKENINK